MVSRGEIEKNWETHIGSRHMSSVDELLLLNRYRKDNTVPFAQLCAMYLTTKHWKAVRKCALWRDKFRCVKCGSNVNLHVDHLRYEKTFGVEKLEDLQTLCLVCHAAKSKSFDVLSSVKARKLRPKGDAEMYEMMMVGRKS